MLVCQNFFNCQRKTKNKQFMQMYTETRLTTATHRRRLSPPFCLGEGASVHRLRTLSRGKSRSCFRPDKIKKSFRFLTKHDTTQDSRSCVSLLKSKSGSLIRKRIFRSFTKIQKRIIDLNDPQQR